MAKKDHPNNHVQQQQQQTQQQQQISGSNNRGLLCEEYFPVGTQLKLTKCNDNQVEGEVLALDPVKKILVLKCSATSRKPGLNDCHLINLEMVKNVEVLSEPTEVKPAVKPAETSACEARLRANLQKRRKFAKAFKQGIPLEGINLYRAISKTLEEIDWKEKNIVVMGIVTITPPYKPENVKGNAETAVAHVRKIVEKFHEEQRVNAEKATTVNANTAAAVNSGGTNTATVNAVNSGGTNTANSGGTNTANSGGTNTANSGGTNTAKSGGNAAKSGGGNQGNSGTSSPLNSTPTPPNSSATGTPATANNPQNQPQRRNNANKNKNYKPQTPKPILPWTSYKHTV